MTSQKHTVRTAVFVGQGIRWSPRGGGGEADWVLTKPIAPKSIPRPAQLCASHPTPLTATSSPASPRQLQRHVGMSPWGPPNVKTTFSHVGRNDECNVAARIPPSPPPPPFGAFRGVMGAVRVRRGNQRAVDPRHPLPSRGLGRDSHLSFVSHVGHRGTHPPPPPPTGQDAVA